MNKPLDELYLTWLYSQVSMVRKKKSERTYWGLLRELYKTEFVYFVANDDNRAADGKDLRYEFINDHQIEDVDPDWLNFACSFLEMLIGLSRRLAFEGGGESRDWFWKLIDNLKLGMYNDASDIPYSRIKAILERVIWRTYQQNGRGGLFPLKKYNKDQRKVEIWYQMSAYILELELV